MAPLIVLILVTLLARLAGQLGVEALNVWPASARAGLAVMFCFTAVAHFNWMREDLIRMMPPWVPNAPAMVTFTGVCEILGAAGILLPQTRRVAGYALIVFLVAVLPANLFAARTGVTLRGAPATPAIPRMLLQMLFIALLWWTCIQ
jgi:uncharacterized membrane protein